MSTCKISSLVGEVCIPSDTEVGECVAEEEVGEGSVVCGVVLGSGVNCEGGGDVRVSGDVI